MDSRLLADYAAQDATSLGRRYKEPSPSYRGEFQRDRDRIIHSTAFRRLEYKTQVFVNHEGDLFRTRLTHSIEVAQIGRTIARSLRLNEDLTETIALAHDLGHTPFGHAGQDALNECMGDYGGFEHNLQSLRVVDELEEKYATFDGLNLTFESREGILKHCSLKNAQVLGDVGRRFIDKTQPSLEAQLTNLADEIAYNSHDVDDGLRSNLITIEQLREVALFNSLYEDVEQHYPDLDGRRAIYEIVRRLIGCQVVDLIETSVANLTTVAPQDIQQVRLHPGPIMAYSDEMKQHNLALKRFLRENLYRHYRVLRMSAKSKRIIIALFEAFMTDSQLLPTEHRKKAGQQELENGEIGKARIIADYIAGMTDRYAISEYDKVFKPEQLT
ncbi:deoxyguanosinetriphosphate triphosphohydrolase [Sulfuriflexus mobilis]|uniref:deoxyguanosinetriphosphate triphosphohydrolase n=1 Tax=Sulfuriflexus mobilis TaxID=1811807 RepID=UPI000F835E24|nr:deoxyguanosinetriphosphate triphosphohydrolase [Sulfuriflexus mobilis]